MLSSNPSEWRVTRMSAILMFVLATSWQAVAQTQPDAEAMLLEYAQATKSYDTQRMSGHMHPEALKRFRATIDAALQGPKKDLAAKELLPLSSVATASEFTQLSDVETYKRLNDTIARSSPKLIDMMSGATFEVVGSFLKDDLAYVTYNLEMTVDGQEINTQVVQKLKLHDGKWLLMLPSTAEASIAGIEARFN
jgi:hypothetical protein